MVLQQTTPLCYANPLSCVRSTFINLHRLVTTCETLCQPHLFSVTHLCTWQPMFIAEVHTWWRAGTMILKTAAIILLSSTQPPTDVGIQRKISSTWLNTFFWWAIEWLGSTSLYPRNWNLSPAKLNSIGPALLPPESLFRTGPQASHPILCVPFPYGCLLGNHALPSLQI